MFNQAAPVRTMVKNCYQVKDTGNLEGEKVTRLTTSDTLAFFILIQHEQQAQLSPGTPAPSFPFGFQHVGCLCPSHP